MINRYVFVFAVLVCFLPSVSALGVSPAKIDLDFSPNLKWDFTVNVINNEAKYLDVILYAEGPLSDSVSFKETSLRMNPDEYSKPVSVTLKLPEKFEEPGLHEILLTVREAQKAVEGEPISIGSSLSVVSLLRINVPYPGKYAKANLFISEADPGSEVTFAVEVHNLGSEDISQARATITITGPDGKIVAKVETDEKSVVSMTKRELIAKWVPSEGGRYKAAATVGYDGKQTSVEKEFNVGSFFLRLISITVKNFKLGGIAKFDILTENSGNEIIEQASGRMMLDEAGKRVMDVESNRIDLKPGETKAMNAYWDTEGVSKGVYYGLIKLFYSDKSSENKIRMTVKNNNIKTEIVTGMAVAPPPEKIKTSSVISVVVILLLVIGSLVYFHFRKSAKKK